MTTKADFTSEEWNLLRRAPMMAGLVVVAASPSGPLGALRESLAFGTMVRDARSQEPSNELIGVLVADLATGGRIAVEPWEITGKTPDQVRSYALDMCRKAAALLDRKARPEESRAFKGWLHTVGQKVADAAKEGGFLGIGGTQVSDQETAALTDLRRSLGVAA
jgi:hypothetical protein